MKVRTLVVLVILLVMAAALMQWGFDGTPLGEEGGAREDFPSAAGILNSLGGARQYLAYVLYIKTDKLHHTYYGSFEEEAELIPYFILISWLDPNYVDTYYEGSSVIWAQGRKQEAIDFNLQGIKANPESAELYYSLAGFYLEEKRYEEAAEAFEKAVQYESEIVPRALILMGLSATYHALGEEERARQVLMELAIYYDLRRYQEGLDYGKVKWLVERVNEVMGGVAPEENAGAGGP